VAILFELVVNFGTDEQGVEAAADIVRRVGHVEVRGLSVPLGDPYVTRFESEPYIEFSVVARGLGYGGPGPKPDFDPRSLTNEDITQVGHALYDLLRGFSGYRAAIVGYDPESLVNLRELESEWRDGALDYDGLVLAGDLCERWRLGAEWESFSPGYRWLPYSGSKNIWS